MTTTTPRKTDLLIVGGGPAGLSACVTFSRVGRPSILYDSELYRNAPTKAMHTVLGFEGRPPEDFRQAVRDEIEKNYPWAEVRRGRKLVSLKRMGVDAGGEEGGGFEAVDDRGERVEARKVVLATGVADHLPEIPGLQQFWGTRAIHCIFCHGTETRLGPMGFLCTRDNAKMNPMMVQAALKLWASLAHSRVVFLTHGMDVDTPEGLEESGLKGSIDLIRSRGYEIITAPIISISPTSPSGDMTLHFCGRPALTLPYLAVLPTSLAPSPDAAPLLTESLLQHALGPMGQIQPPTSDELEKMSGAALPPRMGDDPRTSVPGLFWAGNVGSPFGNVNLAVASGQSAGVVAADELGKEDMQRDMEEIKT